MGVFGKIDKSIDRMGYWGAFVQMAVAVLTNWTVNVGIFAGVVMTYASSLTNWLAEWGPVGWVAIGIGTALITSLVFSGTRFLLAKRSLSDATAEMVKTRANMSSVNPLAKTYEYEKIDIRELVTPLTNVVSGKTFVGCQIVGPVNFLLFGTTNIMNPKGQACEAVYADNEVYISNVVEVLDCDFRDCEFYNITFIVLPAQYEWFTNNLKTNCITKNPLDLKEFANQDELENPDDLVAIEPPEENAKPPAKKRTRRVKK